MIACLSESPSIGVSGPNGYGPGSLSSAYWNVTETFGCDDGTTMYGMPYGIEPPLGPKSGCRCFDDADIEASHAALCRFTGNFVMSARHTLFEGKTLHDGAPGGGTATAGATEQ